MRTPFSSRTASGSAQDCCREFTTAADLSRRRFLGSVAAVGAGAVATTMFGDALRQTAFAATPTAGNVLVVLSLRGGIDGLGMVVPHGDAAYYTARPRIAVAKDRLGAMDAMFGLHPKLAPLQPFWDSGEFAAVQAVGMTVPNRSHFSAMEEIEDADPGSSVRRGWVNRMIGLDADVSPVEGVFFGSSVPPTLMTGSAPTLSTPRLNQVVLAGASPAYDNPTDAQRRRAQLTTVWGKESGDLGDAARSAFATVDQLASTAKTDYQPQNGAAYPTAWPAGDLANALKDTAQLIRADVGAEVVSIDFGSWDLHSNYGNESEGSMQRLVGAFASSLAAFLTDLGPLRSKVTVVTISEFGRRVAENGNAGLDHGWGNMMLVLGGGVKGGRYYGRWPGLGSGSLIDGDLQVTTDYRNVFGEILTSRFPDRSVASVFPGLSYAPLGLMAQPAG